MSTLKDAQCTNFYLPQGVVHIADTNVRCLYAY